MLNRVGFVGPLFLCLALCGCESQSASPKASGSISSAARHREDRQRNNLTGEELGGEITSLCKQGKYHQAMRLLPEAMNRWHTLIEQTGRTFEGAGSYLYATTMSTIAHEGDPQWGRILDDPDIPYEYKTELVVEILETRLGKGAVHVDQDGNVVIPRAASISLDKRTRGAAPGSE